MLFRSFAFRSPLMMPVDWNIPEETTVTGTRIEERVTVPGSSVRGAVRSLFEVISSSCLSILDPDYRPAHRASLEMRPDKRLAVVESRPFTLCEAQIQLVMGAVAETIHELSVRGDINSIAN